MRNLAASDVPSVEIVVVVAAGEPVLVTVSVVSSHVKLDDAPKSPESLIRSVF